MKFLFSISILLGGCFYVYTAKQPPFVYAPLILGWLIMTLAMKKKKVTTPPLLQFGKLRWDESNLGHILVLGQTGKGKTVSAITNILTQLTKNCPHWGGMILGVKGNEHHFIEGLFKNNGRNGDVKVLQVKPEGAQNWSPPFRINLTGDKRLPWSSYASMIIDTGKALSGDKGDSFWADTAEQCITHAFVLLEGLGQPPTIPEVYKLLMAEGPEIGKAVVEFCEKKGELNEQDIATMSYFESVFINAKAREQLEGTKGTLKRYLGFFINPEIAEVFCSENPNLEMKDLDKGVVIATSIPQRYVKERKYIHTLIKALGYNHGLLRFDQEAIDAEYIKKCNRLIFIFDEAQEVITASETGMGDHTIADRIRSAKVNLVFSMQSSRSPDSKIGREKRENLINHFGTRFIFQLGEQTEAKDLSSFLGDAKQRKITRSRGKTGGNRSVVMEYKPRVEPVVLMSLDAHQCLITNPSKDFHLTNLAPLDTTGIIPSWYAEKRRILKPIQRLNKHIFYGR